MSKNILILTNSDYSDTPFDRWVLRHHHLNLYLFVGEEKYEQYEHLPNVKAFKNYDSTGLIEKAAIELGRQIRFDLVHAHGEIDLIRAARIRDRLGISGQNLASALAFRDALVMKHILSNSKIPVPIYSMIRDTLDLMSFIEEHGFPIVVKPVLCTGRSRTHVIQNNGELEAALTVGPFAGFSSETVVERFVDGQRYHIDGLISDSEFRAIFVSKHYSSPLTSEDPIAQRLVDFTKRALEALPKPKHLQFHAEVLHTSTDELVFCEVISSINGGGTNGMIKTSFGVDLDRDFFRAQCELKPSSSLGRLRLAIPNLV